jgi:hypothetical protein
MRFRAPLYPSENLHFGNFACPGLRVRSYVQALRLCVCTLCSGTRVHVALLLSRECSRVCVTALQHLPLMSVQVGVGTEAVICLS